MADDGDHRAGCPAQQKLDAMALLVDAALEIIGEDERTAAARMLLTQRDGPRDGETRAEWAHRVSVGHATALERAGFVGTLEVMRGMLEQ